MMLSTCKLYLYDAVYLYLLTVNQTLAEGNADFRDGHLMRNKTIGQHFAGKNSETTRYLVQRNDDVDHFAR